MGKLTEKGASVPPFLTKCYRMVDDESTDAIISWSESGNSFVIRDVTDFSNELLPKYFKHNNFSSFMRQLNIYGFKKIDTDRWEFANDGFVRGKEQLLKNISRRKISQAHNRSEQKNKNPTDSSHELRALALRKEVETLKIDKNVLMQELLKLRQHQETADSKLLLLGERLQGMEKDQQQMLSFIVMAMQSPGFLAQLLQQKENWRLPCEAAGEPPTFDRRVVKYLPPPDRTESEKKPLEFDLLNGRIDSLMSNDLVKMLMDEKLCSPEHYGTAVIPDFSGVGALDRFLFDDMSGLCLDREAKPVSRMEGGSVLRETSLEKSQNVGLSKEESNF